MKKKIRDFSSFSSFFTCAPAQQKSHADPDLVEFTGAAVKLDIDASFVQKFANLASQFVEQVVPLSSFFRGCANEQKS